MEKIVQLERHEAISRCINNQCDNSWEHLIKFILATTPLVRQAVNSHDELVHALKFTRNVIDNACGQLTGNEAKLIYNMVIKALKTLEVRS